MNNLLGQLPLIIGLVGYFVLHSVLASRTVKSLLRHYCPSLLPGYRLLYNLLSIILLAPLVWLIWQSPGPVLWEWPSPWSWLMDLLALLAVAGFLLTFKAYDGRRFLGFTQWQQRMMETQDTDAMSLSFLHRFVRHPWYCFGLVILWTRDMTAANLTAISLITLYLVIGSRLEENKLIAQYGEAYREYRRRVPGLLPLPWRWLNRVQTDTLLKMARKTDSHRE